VRDHNIGHTQFEKLLHHDMLQVKSNVSRFFALTILLLTSSVVLSSCDSFSKKETNTQEDKSLITKSEKTRIEKIGRSHNKALEFIRGEINKKALSKTENLRRFIVKKCVEFAEDKVNLQTKSPVNLEQGCTSGLQSSALTRAKSDPTGEDRISNDVRNLPSVISKNNVRSLSEEQIDHLQRVFQTLKEVGVSQSTEALRSKLSDVKSKAVQDLGREAIPVLIASSVGVHSAEYWGEKKRIENWSRVMRMSQLSIPGSARIEKDEEIPGMDQILAADAGGAAAGAIGAGVTGFGVASFGAGIAMGALVGSCSASTAKAVELGARELLDDE